jgi:undecaprenyl-phosphate 4-deoxy-4-formamido-L-arabinose transferase
VVFQIFHRLVRGEAAEGVFRSVTDAAQFFLFGVVLFGIGLLGEYIGRIYQEVLRRPRFIVSAVLEERSAADAAQADKPAELHKTSAIR